MGKRLEYDRRVISRGGLRHPLRLLVGFLQIIVHPVGMSVAPQTCGPVVRDAVTRCDNH